MKPRNLAGLAGLIVLSLQTLTLEAAKPKLDVLYNFTYGPEGGYPLCTLVQDNKTGYFFGTSYEGGRYGYGVIYKFLPGGSPIVLAAFDYSTTGGYPYAGLIQGSDGNFYGTTYEGGANGYGTAFKVTAQGVLTVLASFDYTTMGGYLYGGLTQASDGNFYGMTYEGGRAGYGTVFKMTPAGAVTVLVNLNLSTTGGYGLGGLIQGSDGNLYGTIYDGGANGYGTVFKMTTHGGFTVLASFDDSTNGAYPYLEKLIQGSDGNFYGTTYEGGVSYGTVFKCTPKGKLTTLTSFDYSTMGGYPLGGLIQASDGNFYTACYEGGPSSYGTVVRVTPNGTVTVLAPLDYSTTGGYPYAGPIQAKDGNLYGTAYEGGPTSYGTLYRVTNATK